MSAIPAANICGVNLDEVAIRFPEAAQEIARIDALMQRGEETAIEFRRLCELLHLTGATIEGEYLLRRNIEHYEGAELYRKLFGTIIPDNYSCAIQRFADEFGLKLEIQNQIGFLDQEYLSVPMSFGSRFNILNGNCTIRFDYSQRDFIVAEIIADDADSSNYFDLSTCLFLRWQNNQWRLIDPRDA